MTDTATLPKLTKREMARLKEISSGLSFVCRGKSLVITGKLVAAGLVVYSPAYVVPLRITPAGRAVLEANR